MQGRPCKRTLSRKDASVNIVIAVFAERVMHGGEKFTYLKKKGEAGEEKPSRKFRGGPYRDGGVAI